MNIFTMFSANIQKHSVNINKNHKSYVLGTFPQHYENAYQRSINIILRTCCHNIHMTFHKRYGNVLC